MSLFGSFFLTGDGRRIDWSLIWLIFIGIGFLGWRFTIAGRVRLGVGISGNTAAGRLNPQNSITALSQCTSNLAFPLLSTEMRNSFTRKFWFSFCNNVFANSTWQKMISKFFLPSQLIQRFECAGALEHNGTSNLSPMSLKLAKNVASSFFIVNIKVSCVNNLLSNRLSVSIEQHFRRSAVEAIIALNVSDPSVFDLVSTLRYEKARKQENLISNLRNIYIKKCLPCDTCVRAVQVDARPHEPWDASAFRRMESMWSEPPWMLVFAGPGAPNGRAAAGSRVAALPAVVPPVSAAPTIVSPGTGSVSLYIP